MDTSGSFSPLRNLHLSIHALRATLGARVVLVPAFSPQRHARPGTLQLADGIIDYSFMSPFIFFFLAFLDDLCVSLSLSFPLGFCVVPAFTVYPASVFSPSYLLSVGGPISLYRGLRPLYLTLFVLAMTLFCSCVPYSPLSLSGAPKLPETPEALGAELNAVDKSIAIVERAISLEKEALRPDRYGRVAAHLPAAMRESYEQGSWRKNQVYLWDVVLELSRAGHRHARDAQGALSRLAYTPPSGFDGTSDFTRVEHSVAISDAVAVGKRIAPKVRKVITSRWLKRTAHLTELSKEYMHRRKAWIARLDAEVAAQSAEKRAQLLERDRSLLMATRATTGMGGGMTVREVDVVFAEIEAAGGTSGGLERWGRSITGIPDQDPTQLPTGVGGGVWIENPLADHYAARYINPWTRAERLLFLEKFIVHGKNFRRIASFFEHKSVEDVVRFYFDNKMPLKLKQLTKDAQLKKRNTKKTALIELSRLPIESRSIRDNFIHQPDFMHDNGDDYDTDDRRDESGSGIKAVTDLGTHSSGRGWTARDRQNLIFALCRFEVVDDLCSSNVPNVWSLVAVAVGSKTPAQCRQFFIHYRKPLGLESYAPPKQKVRKSAKRQMAPFTIGSGPGSPPSRKQPRLSALVRNGSATDAPRSSVVTSTPSVQPASAPAG